MKVVDVLRMPVWADRVRIAAYDEDGDIQDLVVPIQPEEGQVQIDPKDPMLNAIVNGCECESLSASVYGYKGEIRLPLIELVCEVQISSYDKYAMEIYVVRDSDLGRNQKIHKIMSVVDRAENDDDLSIIYWQKLCEFANETCDEIK